MAQLDAGLPEVDLPVALARLHRATPAGSDLDLDVVAAVHQPGRLQDLLTGAGFDIGSRDGRRVVVRRLRTLPDWVGPGMRVLVCGLNPSVVAADAGFGYAGPTNRFWPAALASGLVTVARQPELVLAQGVGMTDLVKRATPSARELTTDEYRAGVERVARLVEWLQPGAVVFVGLAGWRAAVDRSATAGWQPRGFAGLRGPNAVVAAGARAYVMPSTSGLNAHASLATLADHLRTVLAGDC